MKNANTKHKHNYEITFMEPMPIMEQLSFTYKSSIPRWQILKNVSLKRQAYKDGYNEDSAILGLTCFQSIPQAGPQDREPSLETTVHSSSMQPGHRGVKKLRDHKYYIPRIERFYKQVVCFDLLLQCPLKGIMELYPLKKIVLNSSSKRVIQDKKELIVGLSACLIISSQKCQTTRARKSIAGFKLRQGSVLGCKVTLRGNSMYAFLDKLINLVLPRARLSLINHTIDLNGTYNIGVSDPFLFVELEHHYDLFQSLQGFDIALVISPRDKRIAPLFWSGLQILTSRV